MGASEKQPRSGASVQVRFNGIKQGEEKPVLALYLVSESGKPQKKLATLEGEKLSIPSEYAKAGVRVAIGPDVKDPEALPPELLVRYRGEQLAEWQQAGVLDVSRSVWPGWRIPNVCVSGKVEKCSLYLWKAIHISINPRFRPPLSPVCAPICNGVVEIYEQLCCCRWWIDPIDIDTILDKLKHLVAVQPPIPRPGPGPDPPELMALRNELELTKAGGLQETQQVMMAAPHFDAQAEYLKLKSMPLEQAVRYIRESEFLRPYCCNCTIHKVGEVLLNPDGTFTFCYYRGPIFYRIGFSCSYRYSYKVKQWNGTGWDYIYDGVDAGQTFTQDQNAMLETFWGRACDPGPTIDHEGPYVMLENIGDTQSWNLVSQAQTGELTLAAAPANGGLVFPPAPMATDLGVMRNCPWGQTLPLRLRFHPDITGPIGAKYYRIKIIPTNDGSNASGPATILKTPIAWNYFTIVMGLWTVNTVTLGPNVVGSEDGLYLIPDPATDWEWYQFHNYFDTTGVANGRYFVVVEIFDAAGNRLKPTAAPGAGTAKPFVFLRWIDSTTLNDVIFADLVHLFWADNRYTYAHIDDLRMDGVPNMDECQYLVGTCAQTFSAGFRAFHSTSNSVSQPETFMLSYSLWWTRGLGGGSGTLETGNTNKPTTLGMGSPQPSLGAGFCTMLGISPGQHKKCTFALNLYVWAKHWNGSGRIGYDSSDQASFSLEV